VAWPGLQWCELHCLVVGRNGMKPSGVLAWRGVIWSMVKPRTDLSGFAVVCAVMKPRSEMELACGDVKPRVAVH